jgi:hypothetical protein
MIKPFLYAFGLILFANITTDIKAQKPRCNGSIDYNWLQTNEPAIYQQHINIENFINNYINNQGQNSNRLINGNGLIIIPIVVHILYNNDAQNISIDIIQSQINALNQDYRRLNPDAANTPAAFTPVASDFGIEFRLACVDPNGNFTNGVVRKQTSVQEFRAEFSQGLIPDDATNGIKTFPTGSPSWNTSVADTRYLNIWVCNLRGLAGYGTLPDYYSVSPQYDGVVIDLSAFGVVPGNGIFNKGRTATHEIGHWLSLYHLWGSAASNFDCSKDDLCGDTPQQKEFHSGCPSFPQLQTRCNTNDPSTMFMNYMDYANDECMNLFTNDQRARARAMFAVGGPRAAFVDNIFKIQQPTPALSCSGGTVKLFNPTCTTASWSIVSGNATITGGQNTDNCSISSPTPGSVVIRATAGNFIDEKTIQIVAYTSSDFTISGNNGSMYWCPGQSTSFSVQGPAGATNYNWSLPSGWSLVTSGGIYVVVQAPSTSYPPSGTLTVNFNEACGSGITLNKYLAYNGSSCGVVPYTLYPNPASSYVNIQAASGTNIAAVQITDNFGNVLINSQYSGAYTGVQIGVYSLSNGPKIARIYSGTQWYSIQFSVQH